MRRLINAFIVFHLAAIWSWCLPESFGLRRVLIRPISPYMLWTGLWQGWDMFSPDPRSVDIRVGAEVDFDDGTTQAFDFPQMDKLSLWERYRRERYRKWANDNLRLDQNPRLWPPAVDWVVGQLADRPARVVNVRLVRRWSDVPPPAARGRLGRLEPAPSPSHEYVFFQSHPGAR